jgi:predicted RNase H-like HicB family nuclease
MDRTKYHIDIFWSDEDGGYVANVPDLLYCSAFGETYEEALREVLVAMELHLATLEELGRPIPEPTARCVIGVRAEMSDPNSAIQIVQEVVVSSVDDVGEVAGQLSDAAAQIVEDLGEGVGAVEEIGESAGSAEGMGGGSTSAPEQRRSRHSNDD